LLDANIVIFVYDNVTRNYNEISNYWVKEVKNYVRNDCGN